MIVKNNYNESLKGEKEMLKSIKGHLKDQRGLTLIELLAVVVILGIIAAIAIPSIGGLIDNTRKDAHISNAQQMISATKTAVSSDKDIIPANGKSKYISLGYLEAQGYLETLKDPDGGIEEANGYKRGGTAIGSTVVDSYVLVKNTGGGKLTYSVRLTGSEKSIPETAEGALKRSIVVEGTVNDEG